MVEHALETFIDIQGYNCSFGFIPKEMAIYDGVRISNFLFKPPFKRNMLTEADLKIIKWSEEYHGLDWDLGNINLNEIEKIITNMYISFNKPKIFVKGNQKTRFLKQILGDECIVSIPTASEPKLSKFKKSPECYFHKPGQAYHCASTNVKLLHFYKNNYQ